MTVMASTRTLDLVPTMKIFVGRKELILIVAHVSQTAVRESPRNVSGVGSGF
ncbi:hypothetical protein Hanom_Chr01g00006761 [Helianthus anomalus]